MKSPYEKRAKVFPESLLWVSFIFSIKGNTTRINLNLNFQLRQNAIKTLKCEIVTAESCPDQSDESPYSPLHWSQRLIQGKNP